MSRTLGVPHIKMLSYTAIIIKNVAGCMILDHNGIVTLSSVMIFASRNGQSIVVENMSIKLICHIHVTNERRLL